MIKVVNELEYAIQSVDTKPAKVGKISLWIMLELVSCD